MSQSSTPVVSTAPSSLTAQQDQVLALLSAGSTLSAAAEAAGVHRNSIAYWRRTSPSFRDALAQALYDKAQLWHDRAEELATSALDAIKTILTDPKTPAGVRLKAALAILNQATTPPQFPEIETAAPAPQRPETPSARPALPETVHKPEIVHKNAQRFAPKLGRNEACPCGSGKKFKRCCLGRVPAVPITGALSSSVIA